MKKCLLLFIAILAFTMSQAQNNNYHPLPDSNAVWNFQFQILAIPGVVNGDYSITFSGDTMINGKSYRKLKTPYVQCNAPPSFSTDYWLGYRGAIRQDSAKRKVYFVPPSSVSEQLLYDFNMQVGDTIRGYLEPTTSGSYTVQAIDSVMVDNSYRKRWQIKSDYYSVYLMEGIGSTHGLVEQLPPDVSDYPTYILNCFHDNSEVLYPDTISDCPLITSLKPGVKRENKLVVFPNPFSERTTVKLKTHLKNATLILSDSQNQVVRKINNINGKSITLNRNELPEGLYFIHLLQDKRILSTEKILITD